MKKVTLLDELAEQVAAFDDANATLALNWDQQHHVFEITIDLIAQNKVAQTILDATGVSSTDKKIEFEDQLLIYDTKRLDGAAYQTDYLAMIPFTGKQGLAKQQVAAIFSYLEDVVDNGLSDLMTFLNDDAVTTFQLKWDNVAYQAQVAANGSIKASDYLPYPRF
ncbi:DUF3013 family protein [Loigolactobacillus iwatensis]|uniref:DUF3013 family protein n=1 Tax=Loigolactobacillus iwatensis TaxID=1267156 RepID=UPI000F7E9F6A|nr:DUF3013 family protein [Loigolactobacillus iwatensis]